MIINNCILEDIERRKRKLDEQLSKGFFVRRLSDLFKKSIKDEANMHSCRLEQESFEHGKQDPYQMERNFEEFYARAEKKGILGNSDAEVDLLDKIDGERKPTPEQKGEMRESFKKCYCNLKDAWKWGLSNFKPDFNEDFIIEIANKIEPGVERGYRKERIKVHSYSRIEPPNPIRIPIEMMGLMSNLQRTRDCMKNGKMSPIELAVLAHYHLERIHPFGDGNGRTSRMMQNLILNHYGYPATIIHKGDKINYELNLRKTDPGFYSRKNREDFINGISEEEKHFYNYLASRENTSIDLILDKAYKK